MSWSFLFSSWVAYASFLPPLRKKKAGSRKWLIEHPALTPHPCFQLFWNHHLLALLTDKIKNSFDFVFAWSWMSQSLYFRWLLSCHIASSEKFAYKVLEGEKIRLGCLLMVEFLVAVHFSRRCVVLCGSCSSNLIMYVFYLDFSWYFLLVCVIIFANWILKSVSVLQSYFLRLRFVIFQSFVPFCTFKCSPTLKFG